MKFKHEYFIIESLSENDICDGKIFYESLKSIEGYNPKYRFVESIDEFKKALIDFEESCLKYLFISAHGDEENIILKSETLNVYDLEEISVSLQKRRIFLSTCNGGSFLFGKYFIKKGVYSVIGTSNALAQIVAVAMWPTMTILFERYNRGVLNFSELNRALKRITKIYQIELSYFSFVRGENKMKEYIYKYNQDREKKVHEI